MSQLLTPKAAAEQLGIRLSTLRRQIRLGFVRHRRIGHLVYLTSEDLSCWLGSVVKGGDADGRTRREN